MDNTKININRVMENVSATLAIEGLKASVPSIEIGKRYLQGELNSEEAINAIMKIYELEKII